MSVDDGRKRIGVHPFASFSAPDQARRLRGRLAAPVTVWTTYGEDGAAAGITVSSILVAEGEAPAVLGLVGPLTDFWEAARWSKRFVVHVLGSESVRVADQFAQRYPGDPFEGLAVSSSGWGPVLTDVATRADCSLAGFLEVGYQILVRGQPVDMTMPEDGPPALVHYRGRYMTVAARR
ncbi:MAG TPA: flavin reductase family protein [Acidimicrobiales bacterium]|nr:flavin reductase family protein [Acidimicrobiales bacterium]